MGPATRSGDILPAPVEIHRAAGLERVVSQRMLAAAAALWRWGGSVRPHPAVAVGP